MNTKGQGLEEHSEKLPENAKNYLFAVAIDTYRHCPPLFNCVRDTKRIKDILHQKYQFDPEHTFTLYNEKATEKNIFDTFKKLVKTLQPKDNLIVLYSGHGEYEKDIDEGYWIPIDAHYGDFSDYVSNSRIAKYIKAIQAHHIFLMVDSCFSGSLFAHKNVPSSAKGLRLDTIPSRWLLTAGRNEVVSDGKPGDHSPFADNIIYFLENNQEESLSVVHLINSVVNAVIYNSRQTPRGEPLHNAGHRGGQFFFHKKGIIPDYSAPKPTEESPQSVDPPIPKPIDPNDGRRFVIPTLIAIAIISLLIFAVWRLKKEPQKKRIPPTATPIEIPVEKPTQPQLQEQQPDDPPEEKTPGQDPKPQTGNSEKAWLAAKRADKEAAYRKFIATFPKSDRVKEAKQRISANYRYTLAFTPFMQKGTMLSIHFTQGAPPFQISVMNENNRKLVKEWESRAPFQMDISALVTPRKETTYNFVTLLVEDNNFKKVGYKLPVY